MRALLLALTLILPACAAPAGAPVGRTDALVAECRISRQSLTAPTTYSGAVVVQSGATDVRDFVFQRVQNVVNDGSGRILFASRTGAAPDAPIIVIDRLRAGPQELSFVRPQDVVYLDVTRSSAVTAFGQDGRSGAIVVYTRQGCGLLPG